MKLAVISDIHSNLAALKKSLEYIHDVKPDKIVCLGDIVGYGPRPNECIEMIRDNCQISLMGNHDHAVLGLTDTYHFNQYAREAINWTRRTLTIPNKAYLEGLTFSHHEHKLLFVHSTPDHPEDWHYILSEYEAGQHLQTISQKICFVGHSHIPVVYGTNTHAVYQEELKLDVKSDKFIINVGSVGQPRDGDPRLCFVIFDTETSVLKYVRLEYPIHETYDEIMENQLPPFLAMRLTAGH